MNDVCPFCRKAWEHGEMAVVVGMITMDSAGSLVFVHRNCILEDLLGEAGAANIIMREHERN